MKPIHSKIIDDKRIEVDGVVFYTQSHAEAVRKYLRRKAKKGKEKISS